MLLVFKWCLAKLARFGMVPDSLVKLLNLQQFEQSSCCTKDSNIEVSKPSCCTGPSTVKELRSDEEFNNALASGDKVVVKFTAGWCKPCKAIQPLYEQLSRQYTDKATFLTVDVDAFEDISSKYKIAMMPTFLVLRKDQVLGTFRGSGEPQLEAFVKEQLT
jgi:thioredoxin